MFFDILLPRACLKIHSHHLHPPLCGIFGPHSVNVAHYASLIRVQSTTKCDAQLSESNFQTRSRIEQRKLILALCCLVFLRKDSTKTFGGDIKHDMQFHRYGSRGTSNELAESILLVMAGNLNKLYSRIIQNFLKSQINARKIKDPAACSGVFDCPWDLFEGFCACFFLCQFQGSFETSFFLGGGCGCLLLAM